MRVVITDGRFRERDPYRAAVEATGAELVYLDWDTREQLRERCRDATVLVTRLTTISRNLIDGLEETRLIMRNGTGYEAVDVGAATEHGIPVSNVPGYGNDEVATHAIALMLAAAHEVVPEDRSVRASDGWDDQRLYTPVHGGIFGIVGLGRIGRAAVQKARGLGMDVIAYDPFASDDVFEQRDVTKVDFDGLLRRADCVSIHAPLNSQTHGMFSTPEFERMKETAVLVNTGRGGIVEEDALARAVEAGEINAAGLDVFAEEPPEDSPALNADRIVCSPHHAAQTPAANDRCIRIGRNEIVRVLEGEPPKNLVNPTVLQQRPPRETSA